MHAITQKTRTFVTMLALAATAGFAATARAGDAAPAAGHYDDVVVSFSDLDLSSVAGNKALYARLATAAERACGRAPATRDLERKAQYRSCVQSTLNGAVDKVGSHELQALHQTSSAHRAG
jgi:UrcA family protein